MVYPTRFQVFSCFPESCFESGVFCDSRGEGEKRGEEGEPEVHVHVHEDYVGVGARDGLRGLQGCVMNLLPSED